MAFMKMLWQLDTGLKVKFRVRIRNSSDVGLKVKFRVSIRNYTP